MESTFKDRLNQALQLRNMKSIELAERTGINKSSISQYKNGLYEAKQDALYKLAKALDVSELWLMGQDVSIERLDLSIFQNYEINKIKNRTPNLNRIAANFSDINEFHNLSNSIEEKYKAPISNDNFDITMVVDDDLMSYARILKDDIVFIRIITELENNCIYALLVDNKVTLRRAKQVSSSNFLLITESNHYSESLTYNNDLNDFKFPIIGKVIAFESDQVK